MILLFLLDKKQGNLLRGRRKKEEVSDEIRKWELVILKAGRINRGNRLVKYSRIVLEALKVCT